MLANTFGIVRDNVLWSRFFLETKIKNSITSPFPRKEHFNKLEELFSAFILTPYYIVSAEPLIIVTVWDFFNNFSLFSEKLKGRKAHILCLYFWSMDSAIDVIRLRWNYILQQKKYPEHEVIFLCNSAKQYGLFRKFNLPAVFCNQNSLLDVNIYKIIPDAKKKYDAMYNAMMAPFKRHFLASKVKNLALITYFPDYTREYANKTIKTLPQATWVNRPVPYNAISEQKVCDFLNQAKVGLCLSTVEGGMFASAEYMLCGLPVVSTRSQGGRDAFFDNKYVKIVDDSPQAVMDGVNEMVNRKVQSEYIRKKTLAKMKPHRERFVKLVQNIYDREGANRDFRDEWSRIFINKMLKWGRLYHINQYIMQKALMEKNKKQKNFLAK